MSTAIEQMNGRQRLAQAERRFAAALDLFEAAVERRTAADAVRIDLDEALGLVQDDRSRLALDLDGAVGRVNRLLAANVDVAHRLDRAGARIAGVLDAQVTADAAPGDVG